MQPGHELRLAEAPLFESTRADAGNEASQRMRQDVIARPAVQIEGLADLVERLVGAYARDLQGPVAARIDSGGFVVIPEDAGVHRCPSFLDRGSLTPGR